MLSSDNNHSLLAIYRLTADAADLSGELTKAWPEYARRHIRITAGNAHKLPALALPKRGCLNIHPALLHLADLVRFKSF
jgi:hypothetical protein